MENKQTEEITDASEAEMIEPFEELIPTMNVNLPTNQEREEIISHESLIGIYDEILNDLRDDRKEVNDLLGTMVNMVINDGDATTASKEAVVNLVKIKTDISDKKAKIADLMTRVVLKEKDTFPRYLAANQSNTININGKSTKRALLEAIQKSKKKEIDE